MKVLLAVLLTFTSSFSEGALNQKRDHGLPVTRQDLRFMLQAAPTVQNDCAGCPFRPYSPNGITIVPSITAGTANSHNISLTGDNSKTYNSGSYACTLYIRLFGWIEVKKVGPSDSCTTGFKCPIAPANSVTLSIVIDTDGSQIRGDYKGVCSFSEAALGDYAKFTIFFSVS